ncbi:glutamine synthetase beta-grasp domain-containing protein [Nannocystis pusilla]|uniref:Glutamine synthetase n=1 Tax=Nannocystis pusilla TaxID=889268 RepID=A0A9X3EII1_9BACT|nr:glutamine synthetase GlnII [Nannocystis pusilla]MCY1004321.1 glutamine synthetase beta-grasp domain-containing protein [Nannocystis pusilla]
MSNYKAEYIWLDGTRPTALMRSKTKILAAGEEPPVWGFDGSSTNQAAGHSSDCVLQPVCVVPDPIRGGDHKLVLCEVFMTDMTPHPTNTRALLRGPAETYAAHESLFGLEQEYTFLKPDGTPLAFPANGYPAPQGPYYCGVGGSQVFGREIVEAHLSACLAAGLGVSGINAEVMPGQWEFQVGPLSPLDVSDHLILARWLLCRIAEQFRCDATFDPKPARGDWNGAGCHTNYSTKAMRESYDACIAACEALRERAAEHVANYGHGIEDRLTGRHETQRWDTFSFGVSDRGASIRIPWQVARDKRGYIEDRRPNANSDPYVVTRMIVETVCGAAASRAG